MPLAATLLSVIVAVSGPLADTARVSDGLVVRTRGGDALCGEVTTALPVAARPTVVFISGAGPHTRDYSTDTGNGDVGNRAFEVLRDAVVRAGYTAVRFDERGTGCSSGDYAATATTMTLAEDVEDLVLGLRQRPEVASNNIVLLGHSEGPIIAMLVASRMPEVSGIISLAGPAWRGHRVIEWQHRQRLRAAQREGDIAQQNALRSALEQEHRNRSESDVWYRFFLDFEPLSVVPTVKVPLLLIHGEDDELVAVEQAIEVAAAAERSGNNRVTLRVLRGHDHALEAGPARCYPGCLSDTVRREIVQWLLKERPPE